MKINIEIDMTPQEARELMGWPNVSELHQAIINTMMEQARSGNSDSMMALLKPYLDGGQQAFSTYQKLFEGMMSAGSGKKTKE